jgi:hypothetical protein
MRGQTSAVSGFFALIVAMTPVWAQEARDIEVTPYVALGSAAAPPVGALLTVPITSTLSLETELGYRRGEGDLHALSTSTSLLWLLPRVGHASPYLAAGVGLAQYGRPVFSLSGPPSGTQRSLAMTVNAGGGLKMPVNENLDLRTDARWFKMIGQGSDGFRVAQGIAFDVGKR